jgi:putative protein-disulfide isomerase
MALSAMAQPKPKLIYIGDPMCSWCYGISEELSRVKAHFEEKVDFEMVMGGLRPYNTQTMVELKGFLTDHWSEVNQTSGQKFNYQILNEKTITYDTEPPSRATLVVRTLKPKKEFEFFKAIQKTFYLENKNMHLAESYQEVLKEMKIEVDEFGKLFNSSEMKNRIKNDFNRAQDLKVYSFPTLLLQTGQSVEVIVNGFSTKEEMIRRIEKLL